MRRTFWDLVGGGKMSLVFSVVTLLVAAVAAYIAQSHDVHALPTAAWALGSGSTTIAILCACVLAVAWHQTLMTQRDAAGEEVIRLRRLSNPEFPIHKLVVEPPQYLDAPDWRDSERLVRLLFLPIRYTNRSPNRRVSLQVDLVWRRVFDGKEDLGPYTVSHCRYPAEFDHVLDLPLHVDPERTVHGDLTFEPWEDFVFDYGDTLEVWVREPYRLSLRLTDDVSGATVEHPVPERPRTSSYNRMLWRRRDKPAWRRRWKSSTSKE